MPLNKDGYDFPLVNVNALSIRGRKPVYGIGVNDADYIISRKVDGKQITCPIYEKWKAMMKRCYNAAYKKTNPAYDGCSVDPAWHEFTVFRSWMLARDWQDMELDKDLIDPTNKVYGPDACVFVPRWLNALVKANTAKRGKYPQGVVSVGNRFRAAFTKQGQPVYIGSYTTVEEAAYAYGHTKGKYVLEVADQYESIDPRIAEGLRDHIRIIARDYIKLKTAV
ncbi:MAG: hypothetical protein HRU20_14555 [Pseudomonadales bacterium]|nr:hypothetical protein [Pseudomonadales bacterium]